MGSYGCITGFLDKGGLFPLEGADAVMPASVHKTNLLFIYQFKIKCCISLSSVTLGMIFVKGFGRFGCGNAFSVCYGA